MNFRSICSMSVYLVLNYLWTTVASGDHNYCTGDSIHSQVECYECSTQSANSQFCADPFNRSHPNVRTAICQGPCAKWLQKPKNGPVHYVRTCSSNLHHRLSISLVCMKESLPGEGRLCFCHRPLCNRATTTSLPSSILMLALLLLTINQQHRSVVVSPHTTRRRRHHRPIFTNLSTLSLSS